MSARLAGVLKKEHRMILNDQKEGKKNGKIQSVLLESGGVYL